ncbi:plasminogen receptor (KT) isoform X1 [Nannospalax galili]|nr:plasminogen receptor (KT) isoform X1 [Nannospalax galili]
MHCQGEPIPRLCPQGPVSTVIRRSRDWRPLQRSPSPAPSPVSASRGGEGAWARPRGWRGRTGRRDSGLSCSPWGDRSGLPEGCASSCLASQPLTLLPRSFFQHIQSLRPTEETQKEVKMGFIFSKSMNENMKNQQEFMLMNARLQLERQLMMQNEMRERQMAMQIAWSREFLKYFGTFFGIATISLTAGAIKRKKPALLIPIVPLSFVFTYQYDLGYGTLLQRMKSEAEGILETEKNKLELPKGMITFEGLEKARREQSKFFIEK